MNSAIFDKIRKTSGFRLDGLLLTLALLDGDVSLSLFISWTIGLRDTGAPCSYSHTRLRGGKHGGSNGTRSLTQNPVHWRSSAIKGLHSSLNIGPDLGRANHPPINKFRVCASEFFQIPASQGCPVGVVVLVEGQKS